VRDKTMPGINVAWCLFSNKIAGLEIAIELWLSEGGYFYLLAPAQPGVETQLRGKSQGPAV
jgi:hypothetical protein